MARTNLRRAFRNDRMRALYDRAIDYGWSATLDGAGHVRMVSPDSKTVMVLSTTAVAQGRSVLNNEAVLKRWMRMQNAITLVRRPEVRALVPEATRRIEDIPMETPVKPEIAGDETTVISYTCACGCGQPVDSEGKYLRGHWMRSEEGRRVAAEAGAKNKQERTGLTVPAKPASAGNGHTKKANDERFSIEEILTVAQFIDAGSGLIETAKLEQGLRMALSFRGIKA